MSTVIQDVREGSKLWKLVTGLNQRLFAQGRQGIRYEGAAVTSAATLAESGVQARSIMQSVAFWRALQHQVSQLYSSAVRVGAPFDWLVPPDNGADYAGEEPAFLQAADINPIRAYTAPGVQRVNIGTVRGTLIEPGDIIGEWLIDDLLQLLAPLRWHKLDQALYLRPVRRISGGDDDLQFYDTCAQALAAVQNGYRYEQTATTAITETYMASGQVLGTGARRYVFGWSYDYHPDPLTYADGLTGADRTLHHIVQYSGNGYDYHPLGTAPSAPGHYTVATGTGSGIEIDTGNQGFRYDGVTNPLQLLGVNCSTPNVNRGFRTDHTIIVQGHYADLQ